MFRIYVTESGGLRVKMISEKKWKKNKFQLATWKNTRLYVNFSFR